MSQLDRVETHFSGGGESLELKDYRPISPLVIVACVAGLASLLAIVHPLLWIFPAVAVVLSVCAIRQVSAAQSRYSGRLAAVAALCVAALMGAYAPARAISLERELYARAQPQVKQWISLIQQGRFQEAHQFTLGLDARFEGPGPLANYYHPPARKARSEADSADPLFDPGEIQMEPSASDRLAGFMQDPLIVKLVEYGEQGSVEHVQNVVIEKVYGNVEVTQRFRASGMHDGQPESIEFRVTSARWEVLGDANWQFREFQIEK